MPRNLAVLDRNGAILVPSDLHGLFDEPPSTFKGSLQSDEHRVFMDNRFLRVITTHNIAPVCDAPACKSSTFNRARGIEHVEIELHPL